MRNRIKELVESKLKNNKFRSVGPGIVAGSSGNDAGGIATYSSIGASFGYKILWLMVIAIPILIVVNDMCARLAVSAKKGLGSMIRKQQGARIALILMLGLFIANTAVVAANLAGMAIAFELITSIEYKLFIIPFAIILWFVVTRGGYAKIEKILLILSLGLLSYIIVAFISSPDLINVLLGSIIPSIELSASFFIITVGLIGATVSPYIYFYFTSAELEKPRTEDEMNEARFDARLGGLWSGLIGYFIILTAATVLFTAGIHDINTAKDAALALKPLAGEFAFALFAIGLFAASTIAAAVLPVSTAYAITETFGLESGVNKKIKQATMFYSVFTLSLVIGASLILIGLDPIQTMIFSMVLSGLLTPIILYILMKMCNDKDILGNYTNNKISNIIGWMAIILSVSLIIIMFSTILLGL